MRIRAEIDIEKSPGLRTVPFDQQIVYTYLRSDDIRPRVWPRSGTLRVERASPAAIFRSRRYHIRESLPNMVNRGGPSFSNDRTARRYETPIQLTVALPARLSGPPWSICISAIRDRKSRQPIRIAVLRNVNFTSEFIVPPTTLPSSCELSAWYYQNGWRGEEGEMCVPLGNVSFTEL